MGKVQERIAAVVAAEVGSRVLWDEPPGLFWLALEGGEPRLVPAPAARGTWSLAPPAQVLSMLADGCAGNAGLLQDAAPGGLHGAAFYSEVWTVLHHPDDAAGIARSKADARAGQIHARPDRVEARSMWDVGG